MNRSEIESVLTQLNNQGKIRKGSYDLLIKKARTGYIQSLKTFQRMLPILANRKKDKISWSTLQKEEKALDTYVANAKKQLEETDKLNQLNRNIVKINRNMKIVKQNEKIVESMVPNYLSINQVDRVVTAAANRLVSQFVEQYGRENVGRLKTNKWINGIRTLNDINRVLRQTTEKAKKSFKFTLKFGLVLYNPMVDPVEQVTLFLPNEGRKKDADLNITPAPVIVKSWRDMEVFIGNTLNIPYLLERLRKPDSGTQLLGITNVLLEIYPLGQVMGKAENLPDHILKSRFVESLKDCPFNLCFFAGLARASGAKIQAYMKPAKRLYEEFTGAKFSKDYEGYDITDLDPVAQKFKMNINVYSWIKNEAGDVFVPLRRSIPDKAFKDVYLLADKNHICYVPNPEQLMKTFQCIKCDKLIDNKTALTRHMNTCGSQESEVCPKEDRVLLPHENQIQKLAKKYKVEVKDHFLPYFACYDYEALLLKMEQKDDKKLQFTSEHVPVSCSIASNLPSVGVKFFCATDYDSYASMNKSLISYAIELSEKMRTIYSEKFKELLEAIPQTYINKDGEEKPNKDRVSLERLLYRMPLVGFNSQKYDINMNKTYGFISELLADTNKPSVIKRGGAYMVIQTEHLKVMDITNYLAPTTYDSYLKSFKCTQTKGFFPYEYFDSIDKLKEKALPPFWAFASTLKGHNTLCESIPKEGCDMCKPNKGCGYHFDDGKKNYAYMQAVWKEMKFKTCHDLLEWYNNLDVVPFVEAIERQQALAKENGFDLLHDALSISAYGEKSLIKAGWESFDKEHWAYTREYPDDIAEIKVTDAIIKEKIKGYKEQDKLAGREFNDDHFITVAQVRSVLLEGGYCCYWCKKQATAEFTLDRKDNKKPHYWSNCVLACLDCNRKRGAKTFKGFQYECNREYFQEVNPQIVLTSDKEIYSAIKQSMVGGPSIVFHRYHARNKTRICRAVYNHDSKKWELPQTQGKLVKKIVGFDANALYLYTLGQYMPCGSLQLIKDDIHLDTSLNDVRDDKLFGFVMIDGHVPEHLFEYFGEMPPFFKNVEMNGGDVEQVGEYMLNIQKNIYDIKNPLKGGKLIGSMKAERMLIYTPLLKWYLEKGIVITKIHLIIKAQPNKVFASFVQKVSDARRRGDKDANYTLQAENAKLEGNGAAGHTIMNKSIHTNTKITDDRAVAEKIINDPHFRGLDEIHQQDGDTIFEIETTKKQTKLDNPLQIGVAVYNLAKLHMLRFYYEFMDKYYNRADFQYCEMDTDSAYMAITYDKFEDMPLKVGMEAEYEADKYNWFTDDRTPESKAYTKRTAGLFKVEYEGDSIVCLNSKVYHVSNTDSDFKMSAKGSQKKRNIEKLRHNDYLTTLLMEKKKKNIKLHEVENRGFRVVGHKMQTYTQKKQGLSSVYFKRVVLADGVTTCPSPL